MRKIYILNENGDVTFFKTLWGVTSYIEPIDVKNSEYELFDSDGLLIRLEAISNNNEDIIATKTDIKDEKVLYSALLHLCQYLKKHKKFSNKISYVECNHKSLEQMIDILTKLVGFQDAPVA